MKLTENEKTVCNALQEHSCQTSKQLSAYLKRAHNVSISATSIGGTLRKLEKVGVTGSSKNEKGQSVYWLSEFGAEMVDEEEN